MPSNNSVTNLFLILQNYLKPFQTWSPPSSPNYCKPLSQSECRDKQKILPPTGQKGHSSNENAFSKHNNTTCDPSNENAELKSHHNCLANQNAGI